MRPLFSLFSLFNSLFFVNGTKTKCSLTSTPSLVNHLLEEPRTNPATSNVSFIRSGRFRLVKDTTLGPKHRGLDFPLQQSEARTLRQYLLSSKCLPWPWNKFSVLLSMKQFCNVLHSIQLKSSWSSASYSKCMCSFRACNDGDLDPMLGR